MQTPSASSLSDGASSARRLDHRQERAAGRAGTLAALAMLAVQLLWRLAWSSSGVDAFPEIVVAAISRLTPLGLFAFATETFGSLAQNALFVTVLVGIVAVGHEAGAAAGRLVASGRAGTGHTAQLAAGLIVAAVLWLVTALTILPIANLGVLARDSQHTAEILVQLGVTMAFFAFAWAALAQPTTGAGSVGTAPVTRRSVLERAAWGGGTVALLLGVGGMGWRLMRSPAKGDAATAEQATRQILASARAGAPAAGVAPTSAAVPRLDGRRGIAAAPEATGMPAAEAASVEERGPSFAELEATGGLTPLLTTVPDFYHVSKNISDPTVDGGGWTLRLDGLVDRPLAIGYEELVSRATTRKITTLCCISNELNGDLIGTAEWQGIPLRDLLAQAGPRTGAVDLKLSCADGYEDSITVERALDPDTLVVVGMNGEPLPPDHGYPARLIVPGIYGMKNVKWLERIEVVDHDFLGYWQTRGWSDPAPYQIWARIDVPADDEVAPGRAVAAGVASAGDRGVSRVEVSVDDGETWADAELEPSLNPPFTWVRWLLPFEAVDEEHRLVVRVTDGSGQVAPEERQPPLPDGATGWPSRTVEVRS